MFAQGKDDGGLYSWRNRVEVYCVFVPLYASEDQEH